MRIVIPGGTGQIGQLLARHFTSAGHDVILIGRTPAAAPWVVVAWTGTDMGDWASSIDGSDVVINLTGKNVNCRYNERNRREIRESRVITTRLIGRAVAEAANPPALWMNASTATIYRHSMDRAMDESTGELGGGESDVPAAWRYSIDVAKSWERAFFESDTPRTRKVALRSAMTMSPDAGGVFDVLLRLVRFGLGGAAGSGTQFVSWIHDVDFLRAIDFLIARQDLDGAVNISSPNPLPNRDFMRDLREAWGALIGLPAARWMLEAGAFVLRTETELILKSRRVVPGRLLQGGFEFEFPDWPSAASNLVSRWRESDGR